MVSMEHDGQKISEEEDRLGLDDPTKLTPLVVDDQLQGFGSENCHILHIAKSYVEIEGIGRSNLEIVFEVDLLKDCWKLVSNLEVWIDCSPFYDFLEIFLVVKLIF